MLMIFIKWGLFKFGEHWGIGENSGFRAHLRELNEGLYIGYSL